MSMMKIILTSDTVMCEERQIVRLKKEIEYMTDELHNREKKLEKIRSERDFLKIYDAIWQEGPKITYKNPENWRKAGDTP